MPRLSGNFAGIEEQLVPTDGIGSRLAPANLETLPVASPAVPTQLAEPPAFSPDQVKNVKGIGKAIGSFSEILGNSAVQKALSSIGIGLDPRGVGGVLGQFGISLAEDNARSQFREQIAGGADPATANVAGLSSTGRVEELQLFRQQQQQELQNTLEERAAGVADEKVDISRQQADTASQNAVLREREINERIRSTEVKEDLAGQELILSELRTKFQNMKDAAASQASLALAQDRKQGEIVDVNKQRLSFIEELTPRLEEIKGNLDRAQKELDDLEGAQSGARGIIARGISETFGGDATSKQAQELADKRLEVQSLEQQFSETKSMVQETLRDFSSDVTGQSNFSPVNTGSSAGSRTPSQGRIPIAKNKADAKSMPDGIVFEIPDGQGGFQRVMNTNGVTRRVN